MDKKLISCAFNIDTACVEVEYSDGSMIAIDCTGRSRGSPEYVRDQRVGMVGV